ncbi:MAG: nuclear transport factor 2 family protein [Pedobacter sp.]
MKTNKEILEEINEAIRSGNYDVIIEYCQEDTKWLFVGEHEINGREAVKEYIKDAYLAPPEFTQHLFADGNYVIATGEISLVDAYRKWTKFSYCDIWKFEDGKIAELKAFVIPD